MRFNCIFFIAAMMIGSFAKADSVTGKITKLWVNQKVWFQLDTMPSYDELEVTCNRSLRFVVDASTDRGKAIYSAVLTAKSLGLDLTVVGNGNCNLHSDSEGVAYVSFK